MRSLNETSTEYKKIVFIVVVVSAIVSLVTFMGLSMLTELSGGNEKLEKLEITSCLWSEDLDSATISIKNTGETALRISQLSINDTLPSQEEWICYPSSKLEPGDEAYVSVSPSLITFEEGKIYIFGLTTESRETFKRTFVAPQTFPFTGTEQLEIQGASWGGTSGAADNTVTLSVQNTGTADLTVDKYKLGVSGTAVDIADVAVAQGGTASVVCTNVGWTAGTTYDIYLITSTGKQFTYRATAP